MKAGPNGCKSCAQWLSHYCSISPGTAREQVRVAGRLAGLPAIRSAFGRGELSYSQVRARSRVATPELEDDLLELARHATAAQLERVLRAYRGVVAREASPTDLEHGDRCVVCERDDDGTLLVRARLPADEGALMVAALEAGRALLRDQASSQGRGVSAEADASSAGRRGAEPWQVVVHVDAASLATGPSDEPAEGACQLGSGEALQPETARRLACDAGIVRILERDGRPLSLGRRTGSIPSALRRALQTRDRCCRFPGCTQHRYLHAHALTHWAHGGTTELANLIQLCRHHHRLVHEGGYAAALAPDGTLRFHRPDGGPVPTRPRTSTPSPHGLPTYHAHRAHQAARHCPGWDGTPLDLPLTIDGLIAADNRLLTNTPRQRGRPPPNRRPQPRPGP